jgi:hypothetical protein
MVILTLELEMRYILHTVCLLCLLLNSCRSVPRRTWSIDQPLSESQSWDQLMPPLAFSNAPLDKVVSSLQEQSHGVQITLAQLPAIWKPDLQRVTFSGNGLRLFEALRIVASVSNRGVLYKGTRAVLAHRSHGDGCVVHIRLVGRCTDGTTKQPMKAFMLKRVKYRMMETPRLAATSIPVTTDSDGHFDVMLPVGGYANMYHVGDTMTAESFPYDQTLVLSTSCEGYIPQTHELPIVHNQNNYGLQIELKKSSSNKAIDDD